MIYVKIRKVPSQMKAKFKLKADEIYTVEGLSCETKKAAWFDYLNGVRAGVIPCIAGYCKSLHKERFNHFAQEDFNIIIGEAIREFMGDLKNISLLNLELIGSYAVKDFGLGAMEVLEENEIFDKKDLETLNLFCQKYLKNQE